MAKVVITGRTAELTKVNISKTISTASEFTRGQMAEDMKVKLEV